MIFTIQTHPVSDEGVRFVFRGKLRVNYGMVLPLKLVGGGGQTSSINSFLSTYFWPHMAVMQ